MNHTGIGSLPLVFFGTKLQKEKYLPGLTSGHLIGAFALTEPDAGSDALNSMSTATLTQDGKYYILNGNKQFITNAGFADIIFTYAKVDGKLFTAFIVEQNYDGVSIDDEEEKMGMKGTSTRAYHFENVRVPIENVLGKAGGGHIVALNALNMGRFKVGAICIGSAKKAFDEAVKYAKQRVQFGRPICQFGLIKEKIGKMAIKLFAAESMMYRTAGLIQARLDDVDMNSDDSGIKIAKVLEDYLIECSINKIYGSETESYVVDEEVQIFGGYGYIHGNHPEVAYRNARINRIWEGTNEVNRTVIINTLIRKINKGLFELMPIFESVSKDLDRMEPVDSDHPEKLDTQKKLIDIAKKITLFVLGLAYQKHEMNLREEQELLGKISDMIISLYALESTFLRSQKMLNGKTPDKAAIPIKMTKVLAHGLIEKLGILGREALEVLQHGNVLGNHLEKLRQLMISPPINAIALRRDIADRMIQYGRYIV